MQQLWLLMLVLVAIGFLEFIALLFTIKEMEEDIFKRFSILFSEVKELKKEVKGTGEVYLDSKLNKEGLTDGMEGTKM